MTTTTSHSAIRFDALGGLGSSVWACIAGPVGSGKTAILHKIAREAVLAGRTVVALQVPRDVARPRSTEDPSGYAAAGAEEFFDVTEFQRRVEGLLSQRPDRLPLVIVDGVGRNEAGALGRWVRQVASPTSCSS